MKITATYLRSVQGQLGILAVLYAGALVLAMVALCVRSLFFEYHVREKYPPLTPDLTALVLDLAARRSGPEGLQERVDQEAEQLAARNPRRQGLAQNRTDACALVLDPVYGAWIEDAEQDAEKEVVRTLFSSFGSYTTERIRRTLVAGNPQQRSRAVELLRWVSVPELKPEARKLCEYARERARRRNEPALHQQAEEVLAQLSP